MSTKSIKAGYVTTAWDEKTVSAEDAEIKITRVRSERKFTGAMTGTGTCHFKGSIDGSPEGEVVFLATNGTFISTAEADWTVDENTAIGGLKGLKGKGGYKHAVDASWTDPTSVWFEYTL
ncbi:hypothetical protein FRC06_006033 [Ceratobasidium sp. 370]|nr:hypothetical protein FRC06_006033 [Ceratobasidium sp. 370]